MIIRVFLLSSVAARVGVLREVRLQQEKSRHNSGRLEPFARTSRSPSRGLVYYQAFL